MTVEAIDLAGLAAMSRDALAERWRKVFGYPAPRGSRETFLRSALGWQMQMAQHLGSSDPQRLLRSMQPPRTPAPRTLSTGTRLLREWQGRTHQVTVLPSGFEHEGIRYRSLSAIARRITGTPWSGPLFFGLRK